MQQNYDRPNEKLSCVTTNNKFLELYFYF